MRVLYDHRPSHAARSAFADLVLVNGRIYTGDPGLPWCSALAVARGRIAARGERADVLGDVLSAALTQLKQDERLVVGDRAVDEGRAGRADGPARHG